LGEIQIVVLFFVGVRADEFVQQGHLLA